MKGINSNSILFKKYPELILHSYQGSMVCTSTEVTKLFQKAKGTLKRLNSEEKNKNISVKIFDNIELGEVSLNNPLNTIHSELEYDLIEDDKKVAFVGKSNCS